MPDDVYPTERHKGAEHSLRQIHIVVNNVLGILNRITSLIRRKRYKIDDIAVAFDDTGLAHIVIAIDGERHDVEQVMRQLLKLHDVLSVQDITVRRDLFIQMFSVLLPESDLFADFPHQPLTVRTQADGCMGFFALSLDASPAFVEFLQKKGHHFRRRIVVLA